MRKQLRLLMIAFIVLYSCSYDLNNIPTHQDIGFQTHELVFNELGDSIMLTAKADWVATGIHNKITKSSYLPKPVTFDPFKGPQWHQEAEANGLKMLKENSNEVILINEGIQEGDTLILSCTSDFVSYNVEEIIITAKYTD